MDFSLNDHQKLIRDTVRQFMEAEVRPFVKEWEKAEKFPAEAIKKLGEMGCCGMLVPEEWGGPGLDTVSYALMLEEVARVFTAMSTALGVTEPAAGSDAAGIQARAVRDGNVYKLSGTKTWVTNGSVAGVLIVFAKTDPAAGGKGISAFLVEPGFAGFRVGRHEDKMGQRSSPSVEILLNDCVVPVENRLGEEGQGLKIALSALDGGRIGIGAQAVGLAQGALEEAVKYAKQRKAFGKSISEFQAIQWMIADMQTEIEAARGLTHYAAWLRDAHPTKVGASASKAKLYASEMVNRVVYKAVQAHGAVGYSRETDVERMYRDARVITIYEGTSEVQRMIIARDLLQETAKVHDDSLASAGSSRK